MHIREFNVAVRPAKLLQRVILSARNLLHLQLVLSRYKIVLISRLISVHYKYKFSLKGFENISKCLNNGKVHLFKKNPLQEK